MRYSSFGRVFQTHLFFKSIFLKTPTINGRMDGRSCSCMLIMKIILNLNMIGRIGIWDIHLISLLFQLVSLNSFNWYQFWPFLYTHICLYVCMFFLNSNGINFYWYLIFHTYIFVDSLCLDMYVYFSLYKTYICLED